MKLSLDQFIEEEGRRLALFSAWWRLKASEGIVIDGSPIWPEVMLSGDWDDQLRSFDEGEAAAAGLTAKKVNEEWVVSGPDQKDIDGMGEKYVNGQDPVFEAKMVITLVAQDGAEELLADELKSMSLSQIEYAMQEGDMIGAIDLGSIHRLAEDEVPAALQALGNDGQFFNHGADEPFTIHGKPKDPDARILRAQLDQGWSSESLSLLQKRFIEGVGLSTTFARWLEAEAEAENAYSCDGPDSP